MEQYGSGKIGLKRMENRNGTIRFGKNWVENWEGNKQGRNGKGLRWE